MTAYHFSVYAIPPAITAAVVIGFAILVAFTRFSRTSVAMLGVCLASSLWHIARVFMYLAADARTATPWGRLACACVPLLAPAIYQFLSTLMESATHRKVIAVIAWLLAAQFAVMELSTNYFFGGVRHYWWGFQATITPPARVLYPLFTLVILAAAIVEIIRSYPKSVGAERNR